MRGGRGGEEGRGSSPLSHDLFSRLLQPLPPRQPTSSRVPSVPASLGRTWPRQCRRNPSVGGASAPLATPLVGTGVHVRLGQGGGT